MRELLSYTEAKWWLSGTTVKSFPGHNQSVLVHSSVLWKPEDLKTFPVIFFHVQEIIETGEEGQLPSGGSRFPLPSALPDGLSSNWKTKGHWCWRPPRREKEKTKKKKGGALPETYVAKKFLSPPVIIRFRQKNDWLIQSYQKKNINFLHSKIQKVNWPLKPKKKQKNIKISQSLKKTFWLRWRRKKTTTKKKVKFQAKCATSRVLRRSEPPGCRGSIWTFVTATSQSEPGEIKRSCCGAILPSLRPTIPLSITPSVPRSFSCTCKTWRSCWTVAPPWGSVQSSRGWWGAPGPGGRSRGWPTPLGSGCCTGSVTAGRVERTRV